MVGRSLLSQPRRAAILDHTATLGGGEIALFNLVMHLDRARYTPVVVLFSDGPLANKLRSAGIETHLELLSPSILNTRKDKLGAGIVLRVRDIFGSIQFVVRLSRALKRLNVSLVHTNSLKADILGGAAAKLARLSLLWHVRDRIESDYLPVSTVRMFRLLCRFMPDYIVANSAATLATLRLPVKRSNHIKRAAPSARVIMWGVVYDGTHHSTLAPSINFEGKRAEGSEEAESRPTIGLIGRITRWKGQDVFIRAAALVLNHFARTRFQIIGAALFGENEYEVEVRQLVKELGLNESVEFLGMRSDVPALIDQMDIVVHASTTPEPFGQVVIEGMAAGKPVIATNAGGVREIIVDGQTGLLVPMADVAALANAICRLLADPALRASMGRAGQIAVRDHFTIEQTAARIQETYDELLR